MRCWSGGGGGGSRYNTSVVTRRTVSASLPRRRARWRRRLSLRRLRHTKGRAPVEPAVDLALKIRCQTLCEAKRCAAEHPVSRRSLIDGAVVWCGRGKGFSLVGRLLAVGGSLSDSRRILHDELTTSRQSIALSATMRRRLVCSWPILQSAIRCMSSTSRSRSGCCSRTHRQLFVRRQMSPCARPHIWPTRP